MAAALAWLALATVGVLAAQALPWVLRIALALSVWAVALPCLRRDLALRSPRSIGRLEHRGGRDWRLAGIASGEPAIAAIPCAHCVILGAVLWLKFDTAGGPRRACVVDRALAMRLSLSAQGAPKGRSGGNARIPPRS